MTDPSFPLPVIGVTTYGISDSNRYDLPIEYIQCVRRAGGIPVMLPPGDDNWRRLIDQLDGLILSGGGDLGTHHYGGFENGTINNVDPERDATELALASYAVDSGLPTLGICRGIQVLNVALGGDLYEHVPNYFNGMVTHRSPSGDPTIHEVSVHTDTKLASILKCNRLKGSSWHHQAIRRIADGFKVTASADDGLVEAVEMSDHPWLVAVQWHPELTATKDPAQQYLFDSLVESARG